MDELVEQQRKETRFARRFGVATGIAMGACASMIWCASAGIAPLPFGIFLFLAGGLLGGLALWLFMRPMCVAQPQPSVVRKAIIEAGPSSMKEALSDETAQWNDGYWAGRSSAFMSGD